MKNLFIMALLLAMTGCTSPTVTTSSGRDFDPVIQEQLIRGKTTKSEVLTSFGEPQDRSLHDIGVERWTYAHESTELEGNHMGTAAQGNVRVKKLEILFEKDVVADFLFSEASVPTGIKTNR